MEVKIIDPRNQYYILSEKHTAKRDKYVTLWRPDNKGYCWPLSLAGLYDGYQDDYHNSPDNFPVLPSDVLKEFIVLDDQGRECIANTKQFWAHIKSLKPNDLCLKS